MEPPFFLGQSWFTECQKVRLVRKLHVRHNNRFIFRSVHLDPDVLLSFMRDR